MLLFDRKLAVVLLSAPLLFAACGKDDDDNTDTGAKVVETPADLRGNWLSPCMSSAMPGLQRVQREYVFNSIGDFDKIERYYSDDTCATIGATVKTIGTVDAKGPLGSDQSVNTINLTINDTIMTLNAQPQVNAFNALSLCGHTDWAVGKEISVINANCAGVTTKKGDVIFDVYSKRNEQLFFGRTSLFLVKDSGDARPTTVDTAAPYNKK